MERSKGRELATLRPDTVDGLFTRFETAFESPRLFVANASHQLRPLVLTQTLLQVALACPAITLDSLRAAYEETIDVGREQAQLIEALLILARSQRALDRRGLLDLPRRIVDFGRAVRVEGASQTFSSARNPPWRHGNISATSQRRPEMGRIIVMNHVSLDGVMQGPGRPEEDTRGGFAHGGWGDRSTGSSDAAGKAMGERMVAGGGLTGWLFGRRTYEDLLSYWNVQSDSSFGPMLNDAAKYVVSTTLAEPLPWPNSTLLRDNVAEAVGELKANSDGVLAIMGSSELIGALMAADLIDEYLLMIYPLVLGSGRRLFPEEVQLPLRLIDSLTTATGLVIATYEPARDQM